MLTKVNNKTENSKDLVAVRCLVTGFDSFGPFSFNPSEKIVQSLPDEHKIPRRNVLLKLERLVLQTCCKESWRSIEKQLGRKHCDVLIMCGLAGNRELISLERFALNIRDYGNYPDNFGHRYVDKPIHPDETEALRTDLPLPALLKKLNANKLHVGISNFAGTFICNEVYYQALRHKQRTGKIGAVIFVHVPSPESYAKTMELASDPELIPSMSAAERKGLALSRMEQAIIETASFCAQPIES